MSDDIIFLRSGWNWITFHKDDPDRNIDNFFTKYTTEGEWKNGDIIKTHKSTSIYNNDKWGEDLGVSKIQVNMMYKILLKENGSERKITIDLKDLSNPSRESAEQIITESNIEIWSWISYPLSRNIYVTDIKTKLPNSDKGIIKSQNKFTYFLMMNGNVMVDQNILRKIKDI